MKIQNLFNITFTCVFLGNIVSNAHLLPFEDLFNFGDVISDTGNVPTLGNMEEDSHDGSTYSNYPSGRLSNANLLPFENLFNFGDSISDTGNAAVEKDSPYGSTYSKHPSLLNANLLPYDAIFNFGDSTSDTGNAATLGKLEKDSPYGSTYFKYPSGRLSNGRLIIDFIAEAYGLPFLPAYLNLTKDQDITKGVNFAFSGATALDVEYLKENGITQISTDKSLSAQFGWFKKFKSSLCKSKEECNNYFKKSLFLVGEIGANDLLVFLSYKSLSKLREIVPPMVESIANTTSALIEEGALELAVPGNFPIGCNAAFLTVVNSTNKEDYDQFGCLIAYNTLSEYFNEQLKQAIETLRKKYPQAKIVYFDYYNDAKRLFQAPQKYGLTSDKNVSLKACCGGGGPYNVKVGVKCCSNTTVCSDLSKRINWDGVHFTEAAYKQIAKGLIEGPFVDPPLKSPIVKIA